MIRVSGTRRTSLATALALILMLGLAQGAGARSQASSQTMTPEEILEYHTKDEKGGSPEAGRPLFEKQCAICHRFGGIGKDVGPDLTTIASRFKKRDVLDAILFPSKVISDQYQAEMFELKDGTFITGVIVRETAAAVQVRTAETPEKPVAIPKGQIANRVASTVSLMPAGLLDGMTQQQIADLLAFTMAPAPAK